MSTTWKKLLLLAVIAVLAIVFFASDAQRYLTLEALKEQGAALDQFYQANTMLTIGAYFLVYVVITALSLPGATILTLAGGGVFGLGVGTIVVSLSSTIGASCAFLVARYLFRDTVQSKFGDKLATINRGVSNEGAFYLFTLRLIPAFPFFLINLLMGLTPISLLTFFFVSQVGMLPGTLVYVNAGTQISQLESLSDIGSPELIGSFVLLGVFPLLTQKVMTWIRAKKKGETYG